MSKKHGPGIDPFAPGDIVQVVHAASGWYPCLIVVEEVESWGVKGYTDVPRQGRAYIRMEHENITKVGHIAKPLEEIHAEPDATPDPEDGPI